MSIKLFLIVLLISAVTLLQNPTRLPHYRESFWHTSTWHQSKLDHIWILLISNEPSHKGVTSSRLCLFINTILKLIKNVFEDKILFEMQLYNFLFISHIQRGFYRFILINLRFTFCLPFPVKAFLSSHPFSLTQADLQNTGHLKIIYI